MNTRNERTERTARPTLTLDRLRRYAITRSLFAPTTLARAIERLGFVQADPIRAPARAQDLILRQRVKNYRAGELERRYAALGIEEDFFINYGFVPRATYRLMHPRNANKPWAKLNARRARALLEFVAEREFVHPREVDAHFAHGSVKNYWGGSSNATTHLLDALHYRGLLRVVGRESGVRLYASQSHHPSEPPQSPRKRTAALTLTSPPPGAAAPVARTRVVLTNPEPTPQPETPDPARSLDALVDVVVQHYAPLPASGLSQAVRRLRYAVPQWARAIQPALARAKERLSRAEVEGVTWYWPTDEKPRAGSDAELERVRLLAPFDPVVWDRRRFELFWGWSYRFEAYTPAAKRKLGYYALPLLWRDAVIGWGNLIWKNERLETQLGFTTRRPKDAAFDRELEAELERLKAFLE